MEARTQNTTVDPTNEEATEAWNGVLFDRFLRHRGVFTTGLGAHGERAMALHPPQPGQRVLDIGCGFGDTSRRLAELVGPEGEVVGIDVAERFIAMAEEEATARAVANVSFLAGDVQVAELGGGFDYAFSRMGTMFFANPVAAMRNVRRALRRGGRLCMVVWRRKLDNDWLHRAEVIVKGFLERNEESDEPTCGPGPFSMADADTTSTIVLNAGFQDVTFDRSDIDIRIGDDLDEAIEVMMALGPAGELIRLAGPEGQRLLPTITDALREGLAEFDGPHGVWAPASTWVVSATAPT